MWIKYCLLSALAFGCQNYLISDISAHYGFAGVFPLFLGYVPLWIVYWLKNRHLNFFTDKPSKLWGVFSRGLAQWVIFACMAMSFSYAEKVKINKGVIASIFTSTIVFTSILFRFLYDEQIQFKQAIVMVVMTTGVVCISVGKPSA